MADYQSNIDLTEAVEMIRRADRVAITTHAKPDGDAFGSTVALTAALKQIGSHVSAWFIPPVPANLTLLRGAELVELYDPSVKMEAPSLLVVVDTGAWSQLTPMREMLTGSLDHTLIIDHHLVGDLPAAYRYVDGQAAACCEVVSKFIDELQATDMSGADLFTPTVCEALYVGIASDTGWFRFSNARPETHELAARLIRGGVDHAKLFRVLEQTQRPEKLALDSRALDSLKFLAQGRVAVMVLRADDFIETGALMQETDQIVDIPQMVESVQLVVLVTEPPPHHHGHGSVTEAETRAASANKSDGQAIRLSLRSKPGQDAVNVAELTGRFGGGGHARAAGAKVHAPLDEVVERISAAAVEAVCALDSVASS